MLSPAKHLDLDRSALRVSSVILSELKRRRVVSFDAVRKLVANRIKDDSDFVLMPALNFLYLIGRVDYHPKTDSFEYISNGGNADAD
ncbi:ABC-three component system middle component 8 [Oceanicaulis alexandrii]|uniref:ABC-three component system middle component 8 n=1 Tax=Oceanicaulis alexandrii TaxID=153233 RepID=UPI0038993318